MSYLIYHPERKRLVIDSITIYHDNFGGNEDPYLWNEHFLHTYCHITQMTNEIGQINFWVSGDHFPDFTQLFCDCVFVIDQKCYWKEKNCINLTDPIVDCKQAYEHHYKWVNPPHNHHQFKVRERYTLKANESKSFQPQSIDHKLIDIIPFLLQNGITIEQLHQGIIANVGSRPFRLDDNLGIALYDYLFNVASIKLFGKQLAHLHPNHIEEEQSKLKNRCC